MFIPFNKTVLIMKRFILLTLSTVSNPEDSQNYPEVIVLNTVSIFPETIIIQTYIHDLSVTYSFYALHSYNTQKLKQNPNVFTLHNIGSQKIL